MNKFFLRRGIKATVLLSALVILSSCASVSYYSQSVVGHSRLMLARKSVDSIIDSSDQALKEQLLLSKQLRAFAVDELGLPRSKSYTTYVALTREFPVWTVVAAPQNSLEAKQWCYPVAGCASYRGYFKESAAHAYALKLQTEGFETTVGGVAAYSTLGWFSDPLLPSMMRHGDTDFAETLFHETAHQQLYVPGDSDFNEAFATVVSEAGVKRWLMNRSPEESDAYRMKQRVADDFFALVTKSKGELQALYNSDVSAEQILIGRKNVIDALKLEYDHLKRHKWNGQAWYGQWVGGSINNAKFAALSTYRQRTPELRALLSSCNDDLRAFYGVLASAQVKDAKLITPKGCGEIDAP